MPATFSWPLKGFTRTPSSLDDNEAYGVDIDVVDELPRDLALARGIPNLANALIRRLTTPRGSLRYDRSYGTDLRSYLLAAMTRAEFAAVAGAVESEVLKDERVQSVRSIVTAFPTEGSLTVRLTVVTASGPFELVAKVSSLTVALLSVG